MVIAVDFDGTIVEDAYPEIGEPKIFAFETLIEMQKSNHQVILWTTREGDKLEEAVDFCRKNGVQFYAVNKSYPEEKYDESISRKLNCDVFVSNKNVGGHYGWGELWQEIKSISGEDRLYKNKSQFNASLFNKISNFFKR